MSETKKPTRKLRIGAVSASIWTNTGKNGDFFRVTFQKLYRQEDSWASTQSFSPDDLLDLAELARTAHAELGGVWDSSAAAEAEAAA